jgi:hypothetical protein
MAPNEKPSGPVTNIAASGQLPLLMCMQYANIRKKPIAPNRKARPKTLTGKRKNEGASTVCILKRTYKYTTSDRSAAYIGEVEIR